MRSGKWREAAHAALAKALPRRARVKAALDLALDFSVWQRLERVDGLTPTAAVETMAAAVLAQ
jgi:hypothetical protein